MLLKLPMTNQQLRAERKNGFANFGTDDPPAMSRAGRSDLPPAQVGACQGVGQAQIPLATGRAPSQVQAAAIVELLGRRWSLGIAPDGDRRQQLGACRPRHESIPFRSLPHFVAKLAIE